MQIDGQDISLDPTASKDVSGLVNEATSQPMANYTAGANSQARGLLNRADPFNQELGYTNPESQAIRSRFSQSYNRSENELDGKMLQNASLDKIKKLQSASDLAGQEVDQNRQKEILKHKIEQANKRARGAIIGTVLGVVGGGLGAYATGGSAGGAMAGYAAGEGVGNMIGGS